MDRLYAGLRRPKTSTISPMIRRLRAKGVQIESVRGKGYRMVRGQVSKALSLDTTYGSVRLRSSLRRAGQFLRKSEECSRDTDSTSR